MTVMFSTWLSCFKHNCHVLKHDCQCHVLSHDCLVHYMTVNWTQTRRRVMFLTMKSCSWTWSSCSYHVRPEPFEHDFVMFEHVLNKHVFSCSEPWTWSEHEGHFVDDPKAPSYRSTVSDHNSGITHLQAWTTWNENDRTLHLRLRLPWRDSESLR